MARQGFSPNKNQNLDSLVDIVSNNVGLLLLLVVFMALFGLVSSDSTSQPTETPPAKKVLLPWTHPTTKQPVFFSLKDNRVMHLDSVEFFKTLGQLTPSKGAEAVKWQNARYKIEFWPVTNTIHCMAFFPKENQGETWLEAGKKDSMWQKVLQKYPKERFYYFFWVASNSLEMFRGIRKGLWEEQREIGWRPSLKGEALELCRGFDQTRSFQPQ